MKNVTNASSHSRFFSDFLFVIVHLSFVIGHLTENPYQLAKDFSADVTCPLTTGIFLRIVAEAAEENRLAGHKRLAPYWRVIKEDGTLNPKFPGGEEQQARRLRNEGFVIQRRGKRWFVDSF